jgi:hypothetical protein
MRIAPMVLTVALFIVIGALMQACIPGIRSAKPPGESVQSPPPAAPGTVAAPPPPEKGKEEKSAPSKPEYKPPPPPEKSSLSPIELREKEAVNEAALKFAKNLQGVEHIKTCYSKLYGGWYVFYYLKKGKSISVHEYSWNPKTEEWELIWHLKDLPPERLESHVKGEVDDEKCFVLK